MQQPCNEEGGTREFEFGFISSIPLRDIFRPLDHVCLMDLDIQGGEREVLPVAMDVISQKVKRILLATHSADLHQAM